MRTVDDKVVVALHQIRDAIKNKECCGGGSDSSSKEVTIDDVVKFIHDDIEAISPGMFPYTTWNDIPDYYDANNDEYFKTKSDEMENMKYMDETLFLPNYVIARKAEEPDA